MSHLDVVLMRDGRVVDHRAHRLVHGLRIGDHPLAEVPCPGVDVVVRERPGGCWTVGPHLLDIGRPLRLGTARVSVRLELLAPVTRTWRPTAGPELAPLIAMLALVVTAAWFDTVAGVLQRHPEVEQQLQAWIAAAPSPAQADPAGAPVRGAGDDAWPPVVRLQPDRPELASQRPTP